MEKPVACNQKILVNELTQGKQLAEQLSSHLNNLSSPEMRSFLVEQLLLCYDKTISLLKKWDDSGFFETKPGISMLESPDSCADSDPKSEVLDHEYKDLCHRAVSKKRKAQPRWINEQVKVLSGSSMEVPLSDGYSWRKYGQKDILGANFPRGYYRCTHRHSQGCLATKRVQRSSQNPTVFEVTYKGRHTCFQSSLPSILSRSSINDKANQNKDSCQVEHHHEQKQKQPKPSKERSFNCRNELKSEDLDIFPPVFSSPGGSYYIGNEHEENDIFKESLIGNSLLGACLSSTPLFLPPTISESIHFSMSPCPDNVSRPEADSLAALITKSEIEEWDISIEDVDFDTSFHMEDHEFLA